MDKPDHLVRDQEINGDRILSIPKAVELRFQLVDTKRTCKDRVKRNGTNADRLIDFFCNIL